ncbi:KilA-N domain-containing protein [Pseudomonas sp. B26(2017)]|uniref:KilA-N domain-containing protein n=1 Tax=Pseudomonas sp. B26(2017) TaxID=1981732 RepID=UPI000A1F39B8|nr:KilA-N domain-containing protein [Pseudomonas sp. B26(2017)]
MNHVIPIQYQGVVVRFNADGWISATEIAKRERKRLDKWLATRETQDYIQALGRHLNTTKKGDLIRTVRGRNGGTWLHPKLAVAFARWLSADFAVWADLRIDDLVRGELTEKRQFDIACLQYDEGKTAASTSGRELARWRKRKPVLEQRVAYWREQLQMTLGIDTDSHLVEKRNG